MYRISYIKPRRHPAQLGKPRESSRDHQCLSILHVCLCVFVYVCTCVYVCVFVCVTFATCDDAMTRLRFVNHSKNIPLIFFSRGLQHSLSTQGGLGRVCMISHVLSDSSSEVVGVVKKQRRDFVPVTIRLRYWPSRCRELPTARSRGTRHAFFSEGERQHREYHSPNHNKI